VTSVLVVVSAIAPVFDAVLSAILRGTVLLAGAACAAALLRRHPAAVRHNVWAAAIAAHFILLAVPVAAPSWKLQLRVPGTSAAQALVSPLLNRSTAGTVPHTAGSARLDGAAQSRVPERSTPAVPALTASAWLLGCLVILLRLAGGTARVWRTALRAERVSDGHWLALLQRAALELRVRRPVTLLRGGELRMPVTWGFVYPTLLLPAGSEAWSAERKKLVLSHELAHVRRFDALTQLLVQLAVAVFWPSPLLWLASRRVRLEREHACDDQVLTLGTRASRYAEELVDMVRTSGGRTRPAFAALAMGGKDDLERRVEAILEPSLARRPPSRWKLLAGALILAALPLGAIRGAPAAPHASLAAAPPRPIPEPAREDEWSCTAASADGTPGRMSRTDFVGGAPRFEYLSTRPGRCLHASFLGPVDLAFDDRSLRRAPAGARLDVEEVSNGVSRRLHLRALGGGVEERRYLEDGRPTTFHAEAQGWAADVLGEGIRESGVATASRVRRIYTEQGLDGVLLETTRIVSTSAKSRYFEALLQEESLDREGVLRVWQEASRQIPPGTGALHAVLRAVMRRTGGPPPPVP
jgi:beta-lactamase regulating signal transducer with metallopeptidase domain